MTIKELRKGLKTKKTKPDAPLSPENLLSSGLVPLNLACSGLACGAIPKGKYVLLVGDSASGKTFLALMLLAEASLNKHFKDYRLIYDPSEDGAMMDIAKFYGPALAERIEPPAGTVADPKCSRTVEEFYYNVDDAVQDGRPFIYIEDSMDALSAEADLKKFRKRKNAAKAEREEAGSYGTARAKLNSENLRVVRSKLKESGSILIIISQTRDKLEFGFEKKTRAGGRAMKFFADLELWFSIRGKIKKTVMGKTRTVGSTLRVEVKKNRMTGRDGCVDLPFYPSHGFDATGACVQYLVDEGYWKTKGKEGSGTVVCHDWDLEMSQEKLVQHIEEEGLEGDLRLLVATVWEDVSNAMAVRRRNRYAGE